MNCIPFAFLKMRVKNAWEYRKTTNLLENALSASALCKTNKEVSVIISSHNNFVIINLRGTEHLSVRTAGEANSVMSGFFIFLTMIRILVPTMSCIQELRTVITMITFIRVISAAG